MTHAFPLTVLFSLVHFLAAAPLQAQVTRFVSVSGDDQGGANTCLDESGPCRTIEHALGMAVANDTVAVGIGNFTEGMLTIDKNLVVRGTGNGSTAIQAHPDSGMAAHRVIYIPGPDTVQISHVAIRHGKALGGGESGRGGGIRVVDGHLILNRVTLEKNVATYGGGIHLADASGTYTNVTIRHNTVVGTGGFNQGSGGGIYNFRSSPTMQIIEFEDNTAEQRGGGMYYSSASTPTVTSLTNVEFEGNHAGIQGGGIYNRSASHLELADVAFRWNDAEGSGGGLISVAGGSATVSAAEFIGNTAGTNGGGMFNSDSSPTLANVTFSGNWADEDGGGMYNSRSSPALTNVLFLGNEAEESGGGMFNGDSAPTLANVRFLGNEAYTGGGMMNLNSRSPELVNVTFSSNRAISAGGGIANYVDSSPMLANVTFSGNSAGNAGGGVYNTGGSSSDLSNVIIWNNQAGGSSTSLSASISNGGSSAGSSVISYSLIANSGGSGAWNDSLGVDDGNNIDEDPLFLEPIDPDDAPTNLGNFRLTEGSPAINAGDPAPDLGIYPTDEDGNPIDIIGNPRLFDSRIDMGAYEFNPTVADEASPEEVADVLSAPHPNPVRGAATFTVAVEQAQDVTVDVFDTLGRRVQTLYDGALAAGTAETLTLDASVLPAGVYVVRAEGEGFVETRRVTVVR